MFRTFLVIALMILSGSAMYLGAAQLPHLLPYLQKITNDHAPKPASTPTVPDDGKSTQEVMTAESKLNRSNKNEAPVTKLDVTRISQDGPSVIAGHAAPFQTLTLMESGKPIATVKADVNGDWVLVTEHKFARADPQISFRVGAHAPQADATRATGIKQDSRETLPSPATAVMKRFEGLVTAAREEAQRKKTNGKSASPQTAAGLVGHAKYAPPSVGRRSQRNAKARSRLATAEPAVTEKAASIPIPMTFIYDEATLTPEGRRAAALLLEYLQLKDFRTVTLTGHADERGTHEYNMALSKQRLDTIARFLRDGGFKGGIDLIPKGEMAPFSAVDRTTTSPDDLWQLDRRVELHGAQ